MIHDPIINIICIIFPKYYVTDFNSSPIGNYNVCQQTTALSNIMYVQQLAGNSFTCIGMKAVHITRQIQYK